jgi:hypothetical protein
VTDEEYLCELVDRLVDRLGCGSKPGKAVTPLAWHSLTCACPQCCFTDYAAVFHAESIDFSSLIGGRE